MKRAEEAALFERKKSRAIFPWMPGFILVSLVAHTATFFLFNVVYPERATLPAPPPPITILDDSTPENQALLQWIEAENPALIAMAPQVEPPNLLKAEYRPSYQVIRTTPRTVAESIAGDQMPYAKDPLSIIRSSEKNAVRAPLPSKSQPTSLSFSGGLSSRELAKPPILSFSKSSEPLDRIRFLIGVTDRGEVRFSFVQNSSGSKKLDAEAEVHLKNLSFVPAEPPLTWGFATFDWGSDVYETADSAKQAGTQSASSR
ncbi:MAG: hypothetical protein JWL59_2339 [Chthoniobacteraceae bacterium]|nr:hypothetical protein [Chthoniobacteraceae bacterium]